jgi:cytochrome c-type biogenesis protein CcmH/NrfF
MDTLPLWIWFAGALVLGLFIAYGILRSSRRTRQERVISNEATKELYKQEDRSA